MQSADSHHPAAAAIDRDAIRAAHCAPVAALRADLVTLAGLDDEQRSRIHDRAVQLAREARNRAAHEGFALGLVHRFGLDTPQGIALMQLAEALPRATDTHSAHLLIADKIGSLSWRDAISDTPRLAQRGALHGLDFLARAFRAPNPNSKLQRLARRTIESSIAALSSEYVLGETLGAAVRKGRRFARKGYRFSYDVLGEAAATDEIAERFHRSYLKAIDFLAVHGEGSGRNDTISVKLSALHPRFEERQCQRSLPLLLERAKDIAVRARAANVQLTLDAEESDRLELTLDVFEALSNAPELADWNGLGLAVQAYQRRALPVIDWLSAIARRRNQRITVRLVKGAYWDTEIKRAQQLGLNDYPIFVRKCETDLSFLACARRLLEQPQTFAPLFATHNAHTAAAVIELAHSVGARDFEFQRLHGMGEHLHDALLRDGFKSRIYAPIGPRRDLLPYLVRRLLENGASSSFVRQLTDTHIRVETLVRDPIQAALEGAVPASVGSPTEVHQQAWPAAIGFDLAARNTAARLVADVAHGNELAVAAPLIDGVAQAGASRDVHNPADRTQRVGRVVDATAEHAREAIAAAVQGHAEWSTTPATTRAAVLNRAAELLEQSSISLIRLAVLEAGKTLDDAIGEVREAVDFCRYYAVQCQTPSMRTRHSVGVVACISPWNFPLAIFLGQVTAALATGNAVVAKPAEQTPLIAALAVKLLYEAGVPRTALQFLPGDGEVGATLTSDNSIDAVCFTGSFETAQHIARSLAAGDRAARPLIAETGGINAMIVDSSALPEQAVRDILISAFQSAGQRCSALRVLCVQEDVADRVLQMLAGALQTIQVGDPTKLDTDVGPLIDAVAHRQVSSYLAERKPSTQAKLSSEMADRGYFVAPSIVEVGRVSDVQREVFGPVLHVVRYRAKDLDSVLTDIHSLGYGLTLGVHSRIHRRWRFIVEQAHIGNVYVNRHQVGAVVGQQPFGGHGLSGTGPKAGGPNYLLRLTQLPAPAFRTSASELRIADISFDPRLEMLVDAVRQAQQAWERRPRRAELVQFATQLLAANTAHSLSGTASHMRIPGTGDLRHTLAHIAGEENTLHLRPRGVLLCVCACTTSLEVLASQLLLATATGNGALAVVRAEQDLAARELTALFRQCGLPEHLVECIALPQSGLPKGWLTDLRIDGIVFDGLDADRQRIARHLTERPGPFLPLLSSGDDMYRFCVEQTVTVNTAAVGGDPFLLSKS